MRSLLILEIEHGDTTDALNHIIHKLGDRVHQAVWNYTINDYTVKVDLPECFRLDA